MNMEKIIVALYILATSSALVLLKLGAGSGAPFSVSSGKITLNLNLSVLSGIFLYGVSFLVYTYLISKYDLGYIIPLTTAFVYIVIFLASFTIFKESFTAFKIAGIALIVGGIFLLNIK